MKIDARQVRFMIPGLPVPGRRRLWVTGKGATLHLQETALVIEGPVKRLWLPVADWFFARVLSEWTTVTVPYSCILKCRFKRLWVRRGLMTLLVWAPAGLSAAALFERSADRASVLYLLGVFSFLGLVLTLYFNLRLLAPRHYLTYRTANGGRVLTAFRVRSRTRRAEFDELLESNRRAAANLARPAPDRAPAGSPALPLVLLVVYVLVHTLAPMISLWFAEPAQPAPPTTPWWMSDVDHYWPGFELLLLPFLYLLVQQGPVLLLAALAWRWSEGTRWTAVALLTVRGLVALPGTAAWRLLHLPPFAFWQSPTSFDAYGRDLLDIGLASLAAVAFHLILAVILAAWPVRRPAPEGPGPAPGE
jgi:hypothetical protein